MLAACQVLIIGLLLLFFFRPVTLLLLLPASEAGMWEQIIQDFHQENPRIRLLTITGDNTTDEMEAIYNIDSKQPQPSYDLIYIDLIWVRSFAAAGKLKDLTNLVSESELTNFLPEDVRVGQYQDKLYWLPLRSDVGVLYYREDLLEQAGYDRPPQTFQELLEMSQQIQSQGLADWGYIWQGRQYEGLVAMFQEILAGYGGFWMDQDTQEIGLDQPPALEAVKFLQTMIQEGISPPEVRSYNEDASFNRFAEGDTVFLRNWPYIQPRLEQTDTVRSRVKIAPMVHAPGRTSAPCKGGWGFGISSKSNLRRTRAAWRAIQFFTREDSQRKLILESGYLPSRRSLFSDRALEEKFPALPDLYTAVQNSAPRPLIPRYREASEILQRYLSDALNVPPTADSDQRVRNLMQNAAEETRHLLQSLRNGNYGNG
ncbi:ABC transporter substrate-binding protein [filamentous cyanobacterium CCP2]|nr:ABC transporter substrate-binding protein [filamentous cyanobacterium CCP2]